MTNTEPFEEYKPDDLLMRAIGKFQRVVVIGVDMAGNDAFMCSLPDTGAAIYDIERAKKALLDSGGAG